MSIPVTFCLVCKSHLVDVNRWEEGKPILRCSNCGNEDRDRFTIGRYYPDNPEDEKRIIAEARKDTALPKISSNRAKSFKFKGLKETSPVG